MKLVDLLNKMDMEKVFDIFLEKNAANAYAAPKPLKNKEKSFAKFAAIVDEIRAVRPTKSKDGMFIVVAKIKETFDDYKFIYEVVGKKPGDKEKYGLTCSPWSKWMGCEVLDKSIEKYGINEVAVEIIYDMTFFGCDKDNREKELKDIAAKLKESEKDIEEGRLISGDEVAAEFGWYDNRTEEEKQADFEKTAKIIEENDAVYEELLSD